MSRTGCAAAPTNLRHTQDPGAAAQPFRDTRPLLQVTGTQNQAEAFKAALYIDCLGWANTRSIIGSKNDSGRLW